MQIPFIRPNPPRLSALAAELAAIEGSGIFSNFGPVSRRLESRLTETLFGGAGACLAVANATLGLMLALRQAADLSGRQGSVRYALMPSFTFAAAAQAALWAGLVPLLCDIDARDWLPDAAAELRLLERHATDIAVIFPYATFGAALGISRYDALSERFGIPVVIDAAASLGSVDADGRNFGAGSRHPVVFSMHATKAFATGEAGLVHCTDPARIDELRSMANFGFGAPRSATMPGLNAKLGEVAALSALTKLADFDSQIAHRQALADIYRTALPGWRFQRLTGARTAFQFMPVLLPARLAPRRDEIVAAMAQAGIGTGTYFSPHLAEQPYFRSHCRIDALPVTERVAGAMLALPLSDFMTPDEVTTVCETLLAVCAGVSGRRTVRA